jgi:hypothetical protein
VLYYRNYIFNFRNLQDQFEQYCHSLLDNASKAIHYRLFKDYFGMEVYLDILDIVELFFITVRTNSVTSISVIPSSNFDR